METLKITVNGHDYRALLESKVKSWGYVLHDLYYGPIDKNKPWDYNEHSDNGAWFVELSANGQIIKICLGMSEFQAEWIIRSVMGPIAVYFGLLNIENQISSIGRDLQINILPNEH